MFLLVPAYPGCPGQTAVKRLLLLLSVCLSQHGPTAANPLLHVCCCGPSGQEISVDCCTAGTMAQLSVKAGSVILSLYVGS